MSILTLGSKKRKEGKFPIKEKAKRKERKIPNQRVGESKKKRKEIPNQKEWEKEKKKKRKEGKKAPDQGLKENRRNVQRGLWTGQYLNNTELSPNERKKKEREPRPKIVFSL